MTLVEGVTPQATKAEFALIGLCEAGRVGFGGFFERGGTLALLTTADAAEALGWLAETGFWEERTLTSRPYLYVL